MDRIAELPETADIPADGSRRDAEPRRQFLSAPARPGGEQRQQPEQAPGGIGHVPNHAVWRDGIFSGRLGPAAALRTRSVRVRS
jgi:hypothetical protein